MVTDAHVGEERIERSAASPRAETGGVLRYYDAHNHLQDDRFAGAVEPLVQAAQSAGVVRMVVNGSCQSDWPEVARLARRYPGLIIPSFGYHPWYVAERTDRWKEELRDWLETVPGSAVGEIGLDRWKPGLSYVDQEAVFAEQWELAVDLGRPVSVHCLQAWGPLLQRIRAARRPVGFLLHSFGGSREMIRPLAALGAYFSFPGYFAHPRKTKQQETFRHVPLDRILIETDAPDQLPPESLVPAWIHPVTHQTLNVPAALPAIYCYFAALRGMSEAELTDRVATNFHALFSRGVAHAGA